MKLIPHVLQTLMVENKTSVISVECHTLLWKQTQEASLELQVSDVSLFHFKTQLGWKPVFTEATLFQRILIKVSEPIQSGKSKWEKVVLLPRCYFLGLHRLQLRLGYQTFLLLHFMFSETLHIWNFIRFSLFLKRKSIFLYCTKLTNKKNHTVKLK